MSQTRYKELAINLAIVIVALVSIYVATRVWGADEMRRWIESAGVWAPLALVAAKSSTIVFAPLNGSIIYPIAGGLFGFWKGFALAFVGDALGATISFWISRRFGRRAVEKFIGGNSGLLSQILNMIGTVRGFLVTRVLLFTAQDILAYAAGLTRLPYIPFIIIHMAVGSIPTTILTAFGATLLESPGKLAFVFIGTAIAAVLSMLAFLYVNGFEFAPQKERDSSESMTNN